MAIPTYPGSLPYEPMRDGFSYPQRYAPATQFETEDGPVIRRRQNNTRLAKITQRMKYTQAQYLTWIGFVEDDLDDGTQDFTMPVLLNGSSYQTKRVYLDGSAAPVEPYQTGSDWIVSMPLCVYVDS